jgi:hypothetical protein
VPIVWLFQEAFQVSGEAADFQHADFEDQFNCMLAAWSIARGQRPQYIANPQYIEG